MGKDGTEGTQTHRDSLYMRLDAKMIKLSFYDFVLGRPWQEQFRGEGKVTQCPPPCMLMTTVLVALGIMF
jgi:hypothetical protein